MSTSADRLDLLAVVGFYPPTMRGGSELALHAVLVDLAAKGHRVRAATTRDRRTSIVDGVWRGPMSQTGLEAAGREADVIVTQWMGTGPAIDLAAKTGTPVALYVHQPGFVDAWRKKLPAGSLVVWNAPTTAVDAWAGPSVVCRPVAWAAEYETPRNPDRDAVLCVNLCALKGGATLLAVARADPTRHFVAVQGYWQPPGERQIIDRRQRNVEVLGRQRDLRPTYARTRVLMMPSKVESWGRVGVEAAASGIPVIAHPTPGLRDCLGDAAIWVDRDDTAGWVAALAALDDPEVYRARSMGMRRRSAALDALARADLDATEAALYRLVGR